jgi:hypothetical protein
MKVAKPISRLLAAFIVVPIWYYLLYWLLTRSGAGELQMFLFWIYVPVAVFVRALESLIEKSA